MKYPLLLILVVSLFLAFCTKQQNNPFFNEFTTPFGVPPFHEIKTEHFLPALEEGIRQQKVEIESITDQGESPTFENSVEKLERSGELLTTVNNIFSNLTSANTNEELQAIAKKVAPLISKQDDDIFMNDKLFGRIEQVYRQRDQVDLSLEQQALLKKWYREFVRGGALLDDQSRNRLRAINEELSILSVRFGENVLKENNRYELVIDDQKDLAGLPDAVMTAAAEAASERGQEGKWVFTLHKPSMLPFLKHSERRDLRRQIFTAYTKRGDNGDELDTKEIVSRISTLRAEKAQLLGYPTFAHYVLEERMAEKPEKVYELLEKLWAPSLIAAKREARLLQDVIDAEGQSFQLAPWDWWFYAEKLRKQKYQLNEEELRAYFQLENVRDGAFALATKLYGIVFEERPDLPKYHPNVESYEVKEQDGTHIGILYLDYFPRASKEGGAWMNAYRKQSGGVKPVVSNVCNFSKPTADRPALLSFDEVNTLFHEFGHALHGLLSDCTYRSLSGTDVAWDFVELPSQIMENWTSEPEVLRMYARHFETDETIPEDLVAKLKEVSQFNKGFESVEYLAASFLDMDWHSLTNAQRSEGLSVTAFEKQTMDHIGLIPQIVARYRSTYYSHVFDGSYPAGYYSYYWAEVLDADAFQAFKETSLFDQERARSFRDNILARGATEEPMTLYLRFRGAEPNIDAMLARKGLQ